MLYAPDYVARRPDPVHFAAGDMQRASECSAALRKARILCRAGREAEPAARAAGEVIHALELAHRSFIVELYSKQLKGTAGVYFRCLRFHANSGDFIRFRARDLVDCLRGLQAALAKLDATLAGNP